MDETPQKSTAIPRLSRLPRPQSSIPKPTSSLPRPASVIRPSPSRESIGPSSNTIGEPGPELKNPRLRASASSQQLRSGPSNGGPRNPKLRASASRDQLSSITNGAARAATPKLSRAAHTNTTSPSRIAATLSRKPSTSFQSPPILDKELASEPEATEPDPVLFKRRLTLTRRPSESFSTSSFLGLGDEAVGDGNSGPVSNLGENDIDSEMAKPRSFKPRPSLSERTMETLANIPSSPALSKKSSSFFDQDRARPSSRASRPGSSHNSDGSVSGRASSRATSRPGSSAGVENRRVPTLKSSTNAYKAPLATIEGTPQSRQGSIPAAKTPTLRKSASRPSMATATSKRSSIAAGNLGDIAPSSTPVKKSYGMLPPKSAAKTVAPRTPRPRASVNGLFKKPSLADMGGSNRPEDASSQETKSAWDGSIAPASNVGADNDTEEATSPSSYRKSSAALRDQIAKARAAKRAAAQQPSATLDVPPPVEEPIVPSDDGFDFGMAHNDPFNQKRGENSSKKVLQQRIGAARTSGRLNIAGLGLKEIPLEVTKMYELGSIGANDGSWAESVDLTRFVAADNEFEHLDDKLFPDASPESFDDDETGEGSIFAGLETLDMHGNLLVGIPLGFRRLSLVTSLNLTSNRLENNCLEIIGQMTSLRDLKLGKNLFLGPLRSEISGLTALEILDLQGNSITALPSDIHNMTRLRILNLNENSIDSLPFQELSQLPLTELLVRKNKLSGTLIEDSIESLSQLQTLDVSANQLVRIVPLGSSISLPELHVLSLSMNRLQGLPDMTTWSNLLTLTVDENSISGIPNSFTSLEKLRHADFSSNDIRVIPPEISRMTNLSMMRLSGNPLRDKKFISITTDELKDILATRLEPPPPYQEPGATAQPAVPDFLMDAKVDLVTALSQQAHPSTRDDNDDDSRSDDDFATPPTSAPQSPARSRSQTISSLRSRSRTLSNQTWPVKQGGVLDRSRTESSTLHPVVCSKVAAENQVKQALLGHNLFSTFPNSLSFFADTLVSLSLANNQLVGETYLAEDLEFPSLKELNLSSNRMTGLGPLVTHLQAPVLEKLDISVNRINALTTALKEAFPNLKILLASNNQIMELDPEAIRGLKIVDASSNDISRLNPRLGLLGGSGGLERLDVMGNRFRVPRFNVLERGTEATLRWLRGRVPVADMAAWKAEEGNDDDDDYADVD